MTSFPLSARDRPELGPILACFALVLLIGLQLILPSRDLPQEEVGLAARRPRLVSPPAPPDFSAVLRAPVFAPDRQPTAPASSTTGTGSGSALAGGLAGYAALGVVSSPRGAIAFLGSSGGGTKAVRIGGQLDGWRLISANLDKVVFARGGARLSLAVGAPAAVATPAAAENDASTPDTKGGP